jgi:molybdopterin-containing oxidoreductase family iron-sulfur binding subunit
MASLRELVAAMDAETVQLLLIIGGNPAYTAPADLRFSERLAKVDMRIHLGLHDDETSLLCHWHVPEAHYLESWSDVRAYDGTVTLLQPLIAPLYDGKTAHELLAVCLDSPEQTPYDVVRAYWKMQHGDADFDRWWEKALHDGVVPGTAVAPHQGAVRGVPTPGPRRDPAPGELELVFRPDAAVLDGRFANNGWLQELPRPMTKITWDNVAMVSPATARRLGVTNNDVVELRRENRTVTAPVWITPGHANDCVTVTLGYGRVRAGRVGNGVGFNANLIRTSDAPWIAPAVEVRKTGATYPIAVTQGHFSMENRALVREGTLAEYRAEPAFVHAEEPEPARDESLYPPVDYTGYAWGMAIDLNACTGCNACVVACQSENNIPIVGKDQVMRGREMQWLRIDRYYEGDPQNPRMYNQPVPCMHCENAPCEVVCPVNATVHSSEGLNDQVYNRCVGTKYCQNNCPYKVRRFNFYLYQDWTTESLKMARNPDVTVRSRGVMEKCTYCVQRINYARIESQKDGRKVRDGEITTACQQACPAEAIVFGDINDPASRVSQLKAEPRNYALLAELNTRPRTTYLASLRNPNPELEKA